MRRLARILLTTATVVSLVLCAAVVAVWIRSDRVAETVYGPSSLASTWSVRSNRGMITAGGRHRPFAASDLARLMRNHPTTNPSEVRPGGYSHEIAHDPSPPLGRPGVSIPGVRYAGRFGPVSWIVADGGAYPGGGHIAPLWQVSAPHWVLAAALGALPTAYVIARRLRPRRAGLCPSCGYDLRATPNRCPECGNTPAGPPSPRATPA